MKGFLHYILKKTLFDITGDEETEWNSVSNYLIVFWISAFGFQLLDHRQLPYDTKGR